MRTLMAAVTASLLLTACGQNSAPGEAENASASPGSPKVKAGLWEVKHTVMGTEEVRQQCFEDPLASQRHFLTTGPENACTAERAAIPNGFRQTNRCNILGARTVVEMTFTGGGDAFDLTTATSTNDSRALVDRMVGRHIGPCPSGMRDGDVVE